MAPPASFPLITLALTLCTSTPFPSSPTTTRLTVLASPLPSQDASPPPGEAAQNTSKEHSTDYHLWGKQIPESPDVADEHSGRSGIFRDSPMAGITSTFPSERGGGTVPAPLKDGNEAAFSVLHQNNVDPDFDETQDVSFKAPCDPKRNQGCEGGKRVDDMADESDTRIIIPVSSSTNNTTNGDNKTTFNINTSKDSNATLDIQPITDMAGQSSNKPTSTANSILHGTYSTTSTRLPTTTSTTILILKTAAVAQTASPPTTRTTLTAALKTTLPTTTAKTSTATTTATGPQTTTTRNSVSRPPKVKGQATKVKGQKGRGGRGGGGRGGGKKKSGGTPKSSVSSVPTHHLAKHFTGFVQHVWLPNSTPRPPGPLDDGPFGSILWRDKKYLVSVLIPIGVGFAGAMMIIVMAYASRAWRKRKERLAHAQGLPGSFLEAATSKNDDTAPLHESSDDEF
ncbi:uncharacterized protein LOC143281509 [Babylonia areolata]|uniref:uncharacterized protein LOC143281509 n=1 Tax=Babylonia areolata TaxID=304850 RepID=UPI003FD256D8